MYIRFFAKDDTPQGQVDITSALKNGFRPRFMNSSGQFAVEADREMASSVRKGLAYEGTLEEAVELSLVDILKQIAADANPIGGGSPNFRIPGDLITQARDAIAAAEEGP